MWGTEGRPPGKYYRVKFAIVPRETFWKSILYTIPVVAHFSPFPCLRRPLAGEAGRHSAVPFAFSGRQAPPARPPLRSARPDVPRRPPPARPPSGVGGPASPVPPGLGPRPLRGRSVLRFAPPGAPGLPPVASRPAAPPIRFVCNILGICRFFANFAANN